MSLELTKASMEPTLVGDGCVCEMKEEQSPAKGSLGDGEWAPLSSPKEPRRLQKGLSSTGPALHLVGPVYCGKTGAVRNSDTRGCPEANSVAVCLWKPNERITKAQGLHTSLE